MNIQRTIGRFIKSHLRKHENIIIKKYRSSKKHDNEEQFEITYNTGSFIILSIEKNIIHIIHFYDGYDNCRIEISNPNFLELIDKEVGKLKIFANKASK